MLLSVFFFQAEDGIRDVAVTGVQTCALPICSGLSGYPDAASTVATAAREAGRVVSRGRQLPPAMSARWRVTPGSSGSNAWASGSPKRDRKSTRLNSSHGYISYAVFCLKKKKKRLHATYSLKHAQ